MNYMYSQRNANEANCATGMKVVKQGQGESEVGSGCYSGTDPVEGGGFP